MTKFFVGSCDASNIIVIGTRVKRNDSKYLVWDGNEWILCSDVMRVSQAESIYESDLD